MEGNFIDFDGKLFYNKVEFSNYFANFLMNQFKLNVNGEPEYVIHKIDNAIHKQQLEISKLENEWLYAISYTKCRKSWLIDGRNEYIFLLNNYKNELIHPQKQKQQDKSQIIDNDYFKIGEGVIYIKNSVTHFIAIFKNEYINSSLPNKDTSIFKGKMKSKIRFLNKNGNYDFINENTLRVDIQRLGEPNENLRQLIKQNFDILVTTLNN